MKIGQRVLVKKFIKYQSLSRGAVITPPHEHEMQSFTGEITGIFEDGSMEVKTWSVDANEWSYELVSQSDAVVIP